ncbi:MAG: hypothetical protein JO026_01995 [Patescibacteria group bacterium]|nr:hypothetical protein [Patescibacteria group bacterium]
MAGREGITPFRKVPRPIALMALLVGTACSPDSETSSILNSLTDGRPQVRDAFMKYEDALGDPSFRPMAERRPDVPVTDEIDINGKPAIVYDPARHILYIEPQVLGSSVEAVGIVAEEQLTIANKHGLGNPENTEEVNATYGNLRALIDAEILDAGE